LVHGVEDLILGGGRWWLTGVAATVCAACRIMGAFSSGFNREDPRTNSIYYGLDAENIAEMALRAVDEG
jgi:hypothetical protein